MSDIDYHEVTKEDWSFGEIAPSFQGRVSSNEYKQGSALLYNMLPRSGGGIRRRPGTRFVATVAADSYKARLFPFTTILGKQFAICVCLVSGVATIYIYSMATHSGTPVATITANVPAYAIADLAAITYAQTNGMTWLFMSGATAGTAGGVPVAYVSTSDEGTTWTCTKPTFVNTTSGTPETFSSVNHYPG
jgi:hypothetical protein